MISPSFEAEEGKVISNEEMNKIVDIYDEMTRIQSQTVTKNMMVIKASSLCEFSTLIQMNID